MVGEGKGERADGYGGVEGFGVISDFGFRISETPNPIAAKVPQTFAKKTTTAIDNLRDNFVLFWITSTKLSKYFATTTDAPNLSGRMILLNT